MTEILTLDNIKELGYLPLNIIVNADFVDFLSVVKTEAALNLVISNFPYSKETENWEYPIDLKAMWEHLERILTPEALCFFTSVEPLTSLIRMSNRVSGLYSDLIWQKKESANDYAFKHILRAHENVMLFHTLNSYFRSPIEDINSVLSFETRRDLYEWAILSFSEPMDIILINNASWANTGRLCQKHNRHYIIIDPDLEACGFALSGLKPEPLEEPIKEQEKPKDSKGNLFDIFEV